VKTGKFIDMTASRFSTTGQRAFLFNGQSFRLGIPLTVTEIPIEVSGGYRLRREHALQPYVGAGVGSCSYKETSSDPSAASSNDVDARHAGYLVVDGADVRCHRWIAVSADANWTRISGILGSCGMSNDADENDLGGVAARIRVIVGK
jgi:outer membrane protein W